MHVLIQALVDIGQGAGVFHFRLFIQPQLELLQGVDEFRVADAPFFTGVECKINAHHTREVVILSLRRLAELGTLGKVLNRHIVEVIFQRQRTNGHNQH